MHERNNRIVACFRKTVLASIIDARREFFLYLFLVRENSFLLERKYLSMKGVFLVVNQYS